MTKIPKNTTSFEDVLAKQLLNDEYVEVYLSDVLNNDDPKLFLLAVQRIIKARKIPINQLAKETGVTRQALYNILSNKGNPEYTTLIKLMKAIGFGFMAISESKRKLVETNNSNP